jgi:hypothetical protein
MQVFDQLFQDVAFRIAIVTTAHFISREAAIGTLFWEGGFDHVRELLSLRALSITWIPVFWRKYNTPIAWRGLIESEADEQFSLITMHIHHGALDPFFSFEIDQKEFLPLLYWRHQANEPTSSID